MNTKKLNRVLPVAAVIYSAFSSGLSAAILIQVSESAGNVIFVANGTANLAGITSFQSGSGAIGVNPAINFLVVGETIDTTFRGYSGITGPANLPFGTETSLGFLPSSDSGDYISVAQSGSMNAKVLRLPLNYISGDNLSATTTFNGQTFASFGGGSLTPGSYVWTWGAGANADSLTLQIGAVPEPTTSILIGLSIVWLVAGRRNWNIQRPDNKEANKSVEATPRKPSDQFTLHPGAPHL